MTTRLEDGLKEREEINGNVSRLEGQNSYLAERIEELMLELRNNMDEVRQERESKREIEHI